MTSVRVGALASRPESFRGRARGVRHDPPSSRESQEWVEQTRPDPAPDS
jgi:hypothetical protein